MTASRRRTRCSSSRRLQVVRPRRGPALRQPARRGGLHPRPRGRERRRQVHAGQGRGRGPPPRRGQLRLGGEAVDFASTAESKDAGIAVIYQEPTLFPDLSVTENIFMGRQPLAAGRRIDRPAMYAEAERPLRAARCGHRPAPPGRGPLHRRPADHRDRQGHLARRPAAGHGRADRRAERRRGVPAFAVARSLRDEGRALVFISHRFDEVFDLSDTVTVMRDGSYIDTETITETTESPGRGQDGRPRGR